MRGSAALLFGLAAALALTASRAAAQTLVIELRDEANGAPVRGASVELLARDGEAVRTGISDEGGRVVLAPPAAGEFVIQADRLGYETFRSPLLALVEEGSLALEVLMHPLPIGLEGLEVVTEGPGADLLAPLGLSADWLGDRWIDRTKIEAVAGVAMAADIIRWQAIPGVQALELETILPDGSRRRILCVAIRRYPRDPRDCALPVLNGAVISADLALALDAESIEAIAVLRPIEATTLYGTTGGGGAVLFWTRRGRAR